ncbi:YqiA/YcfP family alpha/beta fold hydrolase [Moraxella sp.]|uniref:YqiA/YcfP family alpha/beta fold hydrolase n=1 Tax=Moraxella sp. TaxID=479 RepID=UPI0026DD7879|nr:YqiA/YcfP family alpha/beta fold hydrolase [Moraxella sp.]MDO4895108.1 YqiA/YcfP family alpha/beta fold hydrolase [Moraxella sp.]
MKLIYLHGLDSDSNAIKAQIVDAYCRQYYPQINVIRPDLNRTPDEVVALLTDLIGDGKDTVLMGSSLGGYFANLMSDRLQVPAVLLNPSIRPDLSFRRFLNEHFAKQSLPDDAPIYRTAGGWQIVYGDLAWLDAHRLQVNYPEKIRVFLQLADELLDAKATQEFYQNHGAFVSAMQGGDHRISDFEQHVAMVVDWAISLNQSR